MTKPNPNGSYRKCWITWGQLLVLTFAMLAVRAAPLPRGVVVPILLAGMLLMAWLIASRFMHLREERFGLGVTVIGSILYCGISLYVLIAFDGVRILRLLAP